jgi:hypothetical protein
MSSEILKKFNGYFFAQKLWATYGVLNTSLHSKIRPSLRPGAPGDQEDITEAYILVVY